MKLLIDETDVDKLVEFFDRTMGKMNVADSFLDAQAISNWNECGVMVQALGNELKRTRDNAATNKGVPKSSSPVDQS